ncbi:MAG: hypothetical protein H6742_17865 [Alphaproteobacteria bacterium]|nr:hypothetical protein [Alphaproteobacteria bacterium]
MARALLALIALLWCMPAQARRIPLDPENRAHAGAAYTDGNVGIFGGLDSRMTRLLYVDVGGFGSPVPLSEELGIVSNQGADYLFLRHGIYVTPGLRVPHRQPKALQWDVLGRLGFAAVWYQDTHPDVTTTPGERYQTVANPAMTGALELLLRKENIGGRLSGRGYLLQTFNQYENQDVVLLRPQYTAELVVQW